MNKAMSSDGRKIEEDISQYEHSYRQIVKTLPAAFYTTDAQGRIISYNDAAMLLWRREPKIGEDVCVVRLLSHLSSRRVFFAL